MNKVFLMGRLTRDPELRYHSGAEGDLAIARFSLAVDRKGRKKDGSSDADFFNCTAFGHKAEFVNRYLIKGTKILLTGRVQNETYTNRDGQKVYSVQVIAEEIEFAESKAAGGNAAGGQPQAGQQARQERPSAVGDGFMDIPEGVDDEELPLN